MKRQLILTTEPLDEAALNREAVAPAACGAIVRFIGVVRPEEDSAPIDAIDYEAFEPMVRRQFGLLFDGLSQRWPSVESVRLVHRLGVVPAREASLWVEVMAPHRAEAFASCQWLIDEMKKVVPIWKRPVGERVRSCR